MPADADAVTRWLAERLLTGSVQGPVLVALVWLASHRLRTIPPAVQAALWWLVALKLVLTLLPLPALSIRLLPAETAVFQAGRSRSEITVRMAASPASEPPTARLQDGPTAEAQMAQRGSQWIAALICLWLLGLGVLALRLLRARRTIRAVVRRSASPGADDTASLAELAAVVGLARVPEVRASGEIDAPQLVGVRRPVVLVPTDFTRSLTPEERAMALCHELMHVRRHDLALGWVPVVAQQLFFFHPLVRVACREYATAREAACDAAVVRALGVAPGEYGRLLLRFGVRRAHPAFVAAGASRSVSSMKRRLEMLQHVESTVIPRRVMWCGVAAVVVAMMPFQLAARTPQGQAATPAAPTPEAAGNRVSVPAAPEGAVAATPVVVPERIAPLSGDGSLQQTPQSAQAEPGVGDGIQAGDPPFVEQIEQKEGHQRHQALEELRRRLAAEEVAMRSSLEQGRDMQQLRAQLEIVQKSLEEVRETITRAIAERPKNDEPDSLQAPQRVDEAAMRLEILHRQFAELARRQEALTLLQQERTQQQERTERQERTHQQERTERQERRHQQERTERQERAQQREAALAAEQRQFGRSARSPRATYTRGEMVSLTPGADGSQLPGSTILAVPGDRIEVSRAGIFVNGMPNTDFSADFIAGLPEDAWVETLPADHYFLAAEGRSPSGTVRFWGLVPADRISGRR